jgi:hypothetical protein
MRYVAIISALMIGTCTAALAQGAPSGRGAVIGDPAASSANPRAAPPGTAGAASSRSGSGTSTSGGKDDNGDQGRDRMPESNKAVNPNDPDKK